MTCPYLDGGNNGKYITSHNFQLSYWRLRDNTFLESSWYVLSISILNLKSPEVSKMYGNEIVQNI